MKNSPKLYAKTMRKAGRKVQGAEVLYVTEYI